VVAQWNMRDQFRGTSMPSLKAIAYASSALVPYSERELESLLADARAFNAKVGVTGVLLHSVGSFFQYIEGPPEGVDEAYARIQAAYGHHQIVELFNGPVQQRAFGDSLMGFAQAPRSTLMKLEQAQWRAAAAGSTPERPAAGVELLLGFWTSVRRPPAS
jgi:hypothetical protein